MVSDELLGGSVGGGVGGVADGVISEGAVGEVSWQGAAFGAGFFPLGERLISV